MISTLTGSTPIVRVATRAPCCTVCCTFTSEPPPMNSKAALPLTRTVEPLAITREKVSQILETPSVTMNEGMFVRDRITPFRLPISAPAASEISIPMTSSSPGAEPRIPFRKPTSQVRIFASSMPDRDTMPPSERSTPVEQMVMKDASATMPTPEEHCTMTLIMFESFRYFAGPTRMAKIATMPISRGSVRGMCRRAPGRPEPFFFTPAFMLPHLPSHRR